MPAIQVRDVPEPIYRKLSELAEREHRSLAQQTLAILAASLNVETDFKARRKKILAGVSSLPKTRRPLPDPTELIREDRNR